jgi:hypothetical protein
MYQKIVLFIGSACHLLLAGFLLELLFDPEDGGSTFLQNVSGHLPEYMALHIGRL